MLVFIVSGEVALHVKQNNALSQSKGEQVSVGEIRSSITTFDKKNKQFVEDLATSEIKLARESETDLVQNELYKKAGLNNVNIVHARSTGKVGQVPGNANYTGFEMEVTGPYQNVMNFISQLERNSYLTKIDGLTITTEKTDGVAAKIEYRIYFQKEVAL